MDEAPGVRSLREAFEAAEAEGSGIVGLLGMRAETLEPGRVVYTLDPSERFANPLGSVHGGILSTLLDSAMSCAVHTRLPEGAGYTTLELKVNFVRPVALDDLTLRCTGTTIHMGRRTATAEGRITSAGGKLVAHGTTTCVVFPPPTAG